MALLDENNRASAVIEAMREGGWAAPITKADLRAAVDAIDAWVDANAVALNLAIPQPARGQLSAGQKARLLVYVAQRRFGVA